MQIDRIHPNTRELFANMPSDGRLLFNWLLKCYLGIIAACGIPTLLFVAIPYMPKTWLTQIEIDPLHYLIAVAIIAQIYYRIRDRKN